ncbi:MAG TPA: molybdate ABC transporter substrate-binding protein [Pyrinomonadaceae bacterium]
MKRLFGFTFVCLVFAGCHTTAPTLNNNSGNSAALTISAAASLKDAFNEVAAVFKKQTGQDVTFNFGASGTLQKQVETGAGVDIFASAGEQQMDALVSKQLIDDQTRRDFAKNELVLIAPRDSKLKLSGFDQLSGTEIERIAEGNPKTVPAGQYAQEVFTFMKFGNDFQQKLIFAEDVRQVLNYVERAEVDAGIVYKTDAMVAGDKVRVIATAPPESHGPILYPIAVVKDSANKQAAKMFIDILTGPEGQTILSKYGFSAATPQ